MADDAVAPTRPAPDGVILEGWLEDEQIGLIKTGKEADVYLVRRTGPERSCLLAAKRYRPAEHRGFKRDAAYRTHRRNDGLVRDRGDVRKRIGGRNAQKAMDQRSRYGRRLLSEQWIDTEEAMLRALWDAGASVPYVVERLGDGLLMEYIGDEERAAPRLAEARVEREELPELLDQVKQNLRVLAGVGIVHADLSAYNVLLWENRLWLIDLPQAVPILANDHGMEFLHRDVTNICGWFVRKGLDVDPEDVFVEVLEEVFRFQMEDLFLAK